MSRYDPPSRGRRRPEFEPDGYAARPLPRRRSYQPHYARRVEDGSGSGGGRLAGLLLALAVAGLIVTHGLWQVTAPDAAGRILRTVLPPLTDLDQTLAANRDALREIAAGVPAEGQVTVPGLPVQVNLTRDEALTDDPTALRRTVLTHMSDTLYRDGSTAFRLPDAPETEPSLLSSQWALRGALTWLTAERHDALRIPRLAMIGATLILAALTLWLLEGPSRLLGPGASLIAGGVLAALMAGGAWATGLLFFGSGDVVDDVVRRVVRDGAMTVLIVAALFGGLGVVITVFGMVARRYDEMAPPASREPDPTTVRQRGE